VRHRGVEHAVPVRDGWFLYTAFDDDREDEPEVVELRPG
jgi:hypothetical protein